MNLSTRICCVLLSLLISGMPTTADDRPDALPDDATSWPELTPSVGTAYRSTESVYVVLPSPAPKTLTFPRLANRMRAAHWLGDSPRRSLSLRPEPAEWVLSLTAPDGSGTGIVVLQVAGRPRLAGEPRVIKEKARGTLTLPAHLAVTHGRSSGTSRSRIRIRSAIGPTRTTGWSGTWRFLNRALMKSNCSRDAEAAKGAVMSTSSFRPKMEERHTRCSTQSPKPVTFRIFADDRPERSTSAPRGGIDWSCGRGNSPPEP